MGLRPIPGAPPGASIPDFPGQAERTDVPATEDQGVTPVPVSKTPSLPDGTWVESLGRDDFFHHAPLILMFHQQQLTFMVRETLGKRRTLCHVKANSEEATRFASCLRGGSFGRVQSTAHFDKVSLISCITEYHQVVWTARVGGLTSKFTTSRADAEAFGNAILARLSA